MLASVAQVSCVDSHRVAQTWGSKPVALDLHEYLGGANLIPTTPHPITGEKLPLTIGHEFGGVVEEVGSDVDDIKIGERVVVQPIIYDGVCGACRDGFINCCEKNGFVGISGKS